MLSRVKVRLPPEWTEPDRRRGSLGAALGVALLAAALAVPAALRAQEFSLYDEPSHADYAFSVSRGDLPAPGSLMTPTVLREWSCRRSPFVELPPCRSAPGQAADYPLRGENYNHGHPPLYYVTVGPAARVLDALVPGANFFALLRLLGLAWLLAGLATFYVGLRRFEVAPRYATAAVAAVLLVPGVLHASSIASNDATAVLAGAAALLVLARVVIDGRLDWLVPAGATALVTAMKVVSALPMLLVAALLGALALARWRLRAAGARELLTIAGAMALAFVVVFQGWTILQGLRGVDDWVSPIAGFADRQFTGSPIDELLSTSFSGFQFVTGYWLPENVDGETVVLWSRVAALLASAAPLVVLATFRRGSSRWMVGLLALVGLIAFPLVAELQVYVQNDQFLPNVAGRYGLAFVPWVIACLAFIAADRSLGKTTVSILVTGILVMLLSVYGIFTLGG